MKLRVIEICKTAIKITGIIRDPKTGEVINTEEAIDAMYKYLVKKGRIAKLSETRRAEDRRTTARCRLRS